MFHLKLIKRKHVLKCDESILNFSDRTVQFLKPRNDKCGTFYGRLGSCVGRIFNVAILCDNTQYLRLKPCSEITNYHIISAPNRS